METIVVKKNGPEYTLKGNLHNIASRIPLVEFLGDLDAITAQAKKNVSAVLLGTINGMSEQVRDTGSHLVLQDKKGPNETQKLLERFEKIATGLVDKAPNQTPLLSWLHYLSTTFLERQYKIENEHVAGNVEAEYRVYEKYYNVTNFFSEQLINELKSNICTKGEFLYNYMTANLVKEDEILHILGIHPSKKKDYIQDEINKLPKGEGRDHAENIRSVLGYLHAIFKHEKKTSDFKSGAITALNAVVKDTGMYSVYDTFVWYVEKGHPDLIKLSDLKTDISDPQQFYTTNAHLLSKVETKFNVAVGSAGKENSLAKQDMMRHYFSDKITGLTVVEQEKLDVLLGLNIEYAGNSVADVKFEIDIQDRDTGAYLTDKAVIDVKKTIFMTLMKDAKERVSSTIVKK